MFAKEGQWWQSRRVIVIAVALVFAMIGYISLRGSMAASPTASIEVESGTKTANAANVTDTSASSGVAVKFGSAVSTTPPLPGQPGFRTNCIAVPSVCGYPDATNTGVPAGVTLTNSGNVTVTQNGAIIQNLNINGSITVRANNVTIRNVRITSGDYYPISYSGSYTGLVVEDSEMIGTASGVTSFGPDANYTARRVETTGGADGFKANSNVVIEDSYIHNLWETETSHNDGTQAYGGSNVTIRHNTYKLSGTNAEVLQFNATNTNWTIENNLLDGGGWVFNAGSLNGSVIRGNRFTRTQGYGIMSISGATYSNNYYDNDGAAITLN